MTSLGLLASFALALATNGTSVAVSANGCERALVGGFHAPIVWPNGERPYAIFVPTNVVALAGNRWRITCRGRNEGEDRLATVSAEATAEGDELLLAVDFKPRLNGRIECAQQGSVGIRAAEGTAYQGPNWPGVWRRDAKGGVPYETCGQRVRGYGAKDGVLCLRYEPDEWLRPQAQKLVRLISSDGGGARAEMRLVWCPGADGTWIASALEAKALAAVHLETDRDFNLFTAPERPFCRVEVVGTGKTTRPLDISADVWDFDGRKVAELSERVTLKRGERANYRIDLPSGVVRGIWFAEARVRDGADEVFCRTDVAVVPPHQFKHRESSMMGIAAYFNVPNREAVFRLMQRMGVRWLRPHNWEDPKDYAKWGFLGVGNRGPDWKIPETNEVARRAFAQNVLTNAVAAGCPILEEGNEQNFGGSPQEKRERAKAYVAWAKIFHEERERLGLADKIKLSTFGYAGGDELYMGPFGEFGGFDWVDILSIHPGRLGQTADADGPVWAWYYRAALQLGNTNLARYRKGKPKELILTETYARTPPNACDSDSMRSAAETVFLSCAIAKAENVSILHWYQLHDGRHDCPRGINEKDSEFHYGLLLREGAVKPSFMAYCAISEALDGATFVGERRSVSDARRAWYFRSPERGPFAVLVDRSDGYAAYSGDAKKFAGHLDPWKDHWKSRKTFAFGTAAKGVSVMDVIGRERTVPAENGKVRLTLTGSPVIVYGLEM